MNEQELFWAGKFGDEYINRNQSKQFLQSNIHLFKRILSQTQDVRSILELGANIGMNLEAINFISKKIELEALEINTIAANKLIKKNICKNVYNNSISNFVTDKRYDLTFTKTVLIHLDKLELEIAYQVLYEKSNRYILIAEYYNPVPDMIVYRGHINKLFRRDFCSEFIAKYPDLKLIDYGFVYHNDPSHPLDDITWFLIEK